MSYTAIYPVLIAFLLNLILGPLVIPCLSRLKLGQYVRDDGPKSHLQKAGTPTMGGVIILLSLVLTSLLFVRSHPEILPIILLTVGFGIVGFLDDYIKIVKKQSLGLRAYQKMIAQILITGIFGYYLLQYTDIGTSVILPFTKGKQIDLGIAFIPVLFFGMIGTVNGVNLTDGLDGLAASVTVLVATFFAVVSWGEGSSLLPVATAGVGSLLGFLLFNAHPARVFMGDTGSLALGGFVAAIAFMLKMPLFLPIVGLIYVVETVSVMIQVLYFKKTRKRFFKMAPIHHHFELSGWVETKVVAVFCILTAIFCLIGLIAL
ncbi:MAG: phospho-N-acetylmuramoyl-pentapeptide-transferase [Epulopiscium sp.]|nr:phospho-N-acetylmuramoyl-pentapeptide-transferase [Candidatus Epulonipiscium sp.]